MASFTAEIITKLDSCYTLSLMQTLTATAGMVREIIDLKLRYQLGMSNQKPRFQVMPSKHGISTDRSCA